MSARIPENVVICIDTSRSMYRTDYEPNRLEASKKALKELIKVRIEEDSSSAFAIVKFSNKADKVLDFTNNTDQLYSVLDGLAFGGRSVMGEGLALSVKILVSELRKVGAKVPRILVVTDGNFTSTEVDPLKIGQLAQGLNINIDAFRIGVISHLNILKKLSDLTQAKFYYSNDNNSLIDSARDFALSNIKKFGMGTKSPMENPIYLRKIAAELLKVQDLTEDQTQRIKQLRGEANYQKCSICFSEQNPATKGSFFLTGRYCPNCQAPFHIHCLAGWASSQKESKFISSGTCRCPHCFYLLKIPTEVTQVQKLRMLTGSRAQKQIGPETPVSCSAVVINVNELGKDAIYTPCPVCNYIFEEGQNIIQCGNPECGALYHENCFQKLNNSQCKKCNMKIEF